VEQSFSQKFSLMGDYISSALDLPDRKCFPVLQQSHKY
jgi:hypothetical protein